MYVAVKGGERAIANAHALLADKRRGDRGVAEIETRQIDEQLSLAVDRVMSEGSLYDREIAALAIKQARGDLIEAIFLARAYRTTLPRFGFAEPLDTKAMALRRRVSATFKDLPGGQVLGPTFDYTHRLIDFALAEASDPPPPATAPADAASATPRVVDIIAGDDLIEKSPPAENGAPVADVTRDPTEFPAARDARLQTLARGDEGFLLGLGYSTQRGYGRNHPFVGEIRFGEVEVEMFVAELGFAVPLGTIAVTECQMVNQFKGGDGEPARFTRGYGLVFGQSERKAMSMALVDRALRAEELAEESIGPAQDAEFVLSHCDNVQATGFVEHLKLPHYVDFQAELALLRQLRTEYGEQRTEKKESSVLRPPSSDLRTEAAE
jgi:alpha-D-ribose 1-methylphosphonate 5-triphosphate synthase subunit PhnI